MVIFAKGIYTHISPQYYLESYFSQSAYHIYE